MASTVKASSFAATLEMVREGVMDIQQHAAFAPLYVRKRESVPNGNGPGVTPPAVVKQ
jgi:segregation and condensation protein A